jgi:hypothetical protein
METLKPIQDLSNPDERQRFFVLRDSKTGKVRAFSLNDLYDRISTIRLHAGVPEDILNHFATALNLLAYSWHYYPFNVTAQFMAYVSVEFALKTRFSEIKHFPFRRLVKHAVKTGVVTDAGFSHLEPVTEGEYRLHSVPPMFITTRSSYAEALIDIMPSLRNTLAHGATMVHMHGPSSVRICAEFINQLFPPPTQGDA